MCALMHTHRHNFHVFWLLVLHSGTQRAPKAWCVRWDVLSIQAPQSKFSVAMQEGPLLKWSKIVSCLPRNLSVFHQIECIPEKYLRIFDEGIISIIVSF